MSMEQAGRYLSTAQFPAPATPSTDGPIKKAVKAVVASTKPATAMSGKTPRRVGTFG